MHSCEPREQGKQGHDVTVITTRITLPRSPSVCLTVSRLRECRCSCDATDQRGKKVYPYAKRHAGVFHRHNMANKNQLHGFHRPFVPSSAGESCTCFFSHCRAHFHHAHRVLKPTINSLVEFPLRREVYHILCVECPSGR